GSATGAPGAIRTATGSREPAPATSTLMASGASKQVPVMVTTRPTRSTSGFALGPLPPATAFRPPLNARQARPAANTMPPGRADRCTALGAAGRPDSAATTGTAAIVFAGRRDASAAVVIASTIPTPNPHHGR